jgi:hypothetical protein
MSAVEKRPSSHKLNRAAEDSGMSMITDICVALVVALTVYLLGSAFVRQDAIRGAALQAGQAEISFQGP